jgi:hypothetical protein
MSRSLKISLSLPLFIVVFGCSADAQEQPQEMSELTWPRVFKEGSAQLTIYDPQIESWDKYERLKARSAIVVSGAGPDQYGVIEYEVETEVDTEARLVLLKDRKLDTVRMQGVGKEATGKTEELVRTILGKQPPLKLSLDFALAYIEKSARAVPAVNVNLEPPPIFSSEEPAILVIFLGEPDFKPVQGTGLQFATNTNWDVLFLPTTSRYYLLNGEGWLTTMDLHEGAWEATSSLPADVSRLPQDDNWAEVRKHIPGKPIQAPKVFVSSEPAELIVTEGRPAYRPIPGTRLAAVTNTTSDLFRHEGEGKFYFLTSGRWFGSKTLKGPWFAATGQLPEDFSKIPTDDPDADIRASVPGTPEADDAVLLAAVPRKATVSRKDVKVAVTYDGDPKFEQIEKTRVYYAVNSPFSVFKVGDRYYCCHEAVWFESAAATGPWVVCTMVPAEIYTIPSTHPKYPVTYVHVYSYTPDTVVVGYTSGYTGMYVASGVVMFGMGLAIGYSSSYWNYHYTSAWYGYGCGAHYNWYAGNYYRSSYAYGPYGGAGFTAGYNPATGNYVRGASAYGPSGSRYAAQSYNPYTGTYKARAGGSTPYGTWERGVATQGNDWARGGYYSNARGTVAAGETSRGGKAVGAQSAATGERGFVGTKGGDMYAGRDGDVYRRNENGWQKYGDGGWNSVSAPERTGEARQSASRENVKSSTTSSDTMQGLQNDAKSRDRGQQTSRQASQGSRGGGGRAGRGGRR